MHCTLGFEASLFVLALPSFAAPQQSVGIGGRKRKDVRSTRGPASCPSNSKNKKTQQEQLSEATRPQEIIHFVHLGGGVVGTIRLCLKGPRPVSRSLSLEGSLILGPGLGVSCRPKLCSRLTKWKQLRNFGLEYMLPFSALPLRLKPTYHV